VPWFSTFSNHVYLPAYQELPPYSSAPQTPLGGPVAVTRKSWPSTFTGIYHYDDYAICQVRQPPGTNRQILP
jgi:hypothetical protein